MVDQKQTENREALISNLVDRLSNEQIIELTTYVACPSYSRRAVRNFPVGPVVPMGCF